MPRRGRGATRARRGLLNRTRRNTDHATLHGQDEAADQTAESQIIARQPPRRGSVNRADDDQETDDANANQPVQQENLEDVERKRGNQDEQDADDNDNDYNDLYSFNGQDDYQGDDDDNDDDDDDGDDANSGPDAPNNNQAQYLGRVIDRMAVNFKTRASSLSAVSYRPLEPVVPDNHHVRLYTGPYDRHMRGQALLALWYGPEREAIQLAQHILTRWISWPLLPPAETLAMCDASQADRPWAMWTPLLAQILVPQVAAWRTHLGAQRSRILTPLQAAPFEQPRRSLQVLVGPTAQQRVVDFAPGDAYTLSQSGIPLQDNGQDSESTAATHDEPACQDTNSTDSFPAGWMLDTGGIVTSMDWATHDATNSRQTQLLALAVSPSADQACSGDYEHQLERGDFMRHGTVQLWEFTARVGPCQCLRPARRVPRRQRTLCFDWGRITRLRWSPACNHLALICGNGSVCIVAVEGEADGVYEKVEQPLVALSLDNEDCIKPTSLAWSSFNRLVVGYSDGSIALWSLHPTRLLGRHAVHHNHVVNLATGYPAMPHVVASVPLGGSAKIIDLRQPSCETTEVQAKVVCLQPNLLSWSDHLLGFFSIYPSPNPLNTMVAFASHRFFPMARRVYTGESWPSCLAVGRTHPFLLVGGHDGSLLCLNPQCELFRRRPVTQRLRLFQHEHRPAPDKGPDKGASRGAARILQGFGVEQNRHAMPEAKNNAGKRATKGKANGKAQEANAGQEESSEQMDPRRGIVHEPGTRITAVEWNPNPGYGCWASAAMASGLVRVLDLGIDEH
ncbi:hypothetical protein CDD82_132 [Ophiocordyceps australis]|uniref:Uncharacterized protein n=1 Tax=Ophiocordyceps australis TaxID=1399860 RepID=A0A2C5YHM3_9HYPO|nr:hypothetical protein CDD82_132 [Ophiocordyceps australis]